MMRTTNIMAMSAAAVLLMASCSKDQITQENPGNAIRLKAFTTASSKATATENTDVLDFAAVAYDVNSALYFSDTYSRNSGTAAFVAEGGTHYWPTDGTALTFIGHSPAQLTSGSVGLATATVNTSTLADANISDITLKEHADEQVDLLAYRATGNGTDNASGLQLYMQHAFSRIIIQAQNENPNMKVEVIGVKIGYVQGKGTFAFPASVTSSTDLMSNRWSYPTPAEYDSYIAGAKELTVPVEVATKENAGATVTPTNLMFGEESFMVIPQALASWSGGASNDGAYIAVLCKIYNKVGTTETQLFPSGADNLGKYAYSAVPVSGSWALGKQYTYTLRFFADGTGGGGTEPPTDPNEPTVDPTIPVDPTPNPGDPVVGGAITLSVAVHAWDETPGTTETEMGGDPASPSQVRQ